MLELFFWSLNGFSEVNATLHDIIALKLLFFLGLSTVETLINGLHET